MQQPPLTAIDCYKAFWTNALNIHGRASRREFWHPYWINFVLTTLLGIISAGTISSIFALAIIIPSFTLMTRRLHDTNHTMLLAVLNYFSGLVATTIAVIMVIMIVLLAASTGSMLFGFIFIIGLVSVAVAFLLLLYTIFILAKRGDEKPNHYGDGGTYQLVQYTE